MHYISKWIGLCVLVCICCTSNAQAPTINNFQTDSVHLTLDSVEARFLRQNLFLLAQQYNIDAQRALELQARLFPNPNLSVANMVYNQDTKSTLPLGKNAQWNVAVSQLIQLAGKRNKAFQLAQANTQQSELEFADLLRTLKYTLRSNFYKIAYSLQSAQSYNEEITALQKVVDAFKAQQGKGYISEKEVIRVTAQLYKLQNEYNSLLSDINDDESELRTIIQQPAVMIVPEINTIEIANLNPNKYSLQTLLDSAYNNRTDLKIAKSNTNINQLNLAYQKALATPDLTLSANYDQRSAAINNQFQIGASIDLPFFNRNQGNIRSAKSMIDMSKITEQGTQKGIEESVYRALQKAFDLNKMYQSIDSKFASDFQRLQNEVLINYQKRNISLLDFLDFYDSYKESILQMNTIKYNKVQAFEDINYFTATNFYN